MLNATLGVKLADGKVTVSLKGINLDQREDPAARLRRHPEAERRGRGAVLRQVMPRGVRSTPRICRCRFRAERDVLRARPFSLPAVGPLRRPASSGKVSPSWPKLRVAPLRAPTVARSRGRGRHRLELGTRDGVPARGGGAPARAGREPRGAAAGARPGPHRQDPARGARARVRGAAGLPRDRRRLRRAALRGGGHLGAARCRQRAALHQEGEARARHHDPDPVGARGGALRLPGGGGRAAGGRRGLLRPRRRQPPGRPLPQPPADGGAERAARLAARLRRLPEVRPPDAARAAQAARARARDARGGWHAAARGGRAARRHGRLAPKPGQGRPARVRLPDRTAPRLRARAPPAARDRTLARGRAPEEAARRRG